MAVSAGQRVSGWTGQCVPGFKARSPLISLRHLAPRLTIPVTGLAAGRHASGEEGRHGILQPGQRRFRQRRL